jgi:hypothetical protein
MSIDSKIAGEKIAQRLIELAHLVEQGQVSALTERAVVKILDHEANLAQTQLEELQADLFAFEQQYGMTSDEFYRQFQAGKTDDRLDYVEWASLVQMAENLRRRLRLITEETAPAGSSSPSMCNSPPAVPLK